EEQSSHAPSVLGGASRRTTTAAAMPSLVTLPTPSPRAPGRGSTKLAESAAASPATNALRTSDRRFYYVTKDERVSERTVTMAELLQLERSGDITGETFVVPEGADGDGWERFHTVRPRRSGPPPLPPHLRSAP